MQALFPAVPDNITLIVLVVVVFAAGFVRGFTGFGFSAIVVSAMALIMDPLTIIVMVMIFEICASLFQIKNAWPRMDKPQVGLLLAGAIVGMPIGVTLLVALDVNLVRMAISILVLGLCLVLLSGWSLKNRPGSFGQFLVGAGSGFANSAAIGGLPVGLFLTAQNAEPATFRANMISYLFLLDIIGIGIMAYHGRFSAEIVISTVALFPVMFLGVYLGSRHFFSTPPKSFRKLVIILLIALAITGLAKSFL
ncbi:MAG TPA: sulfite exporter TauE/SafE family protein [Rhizobiales bacterium]|nr:sulfite exporter TauE/SafE family protein [Hyphomicrobiales bacterium]